MIHHCLTRAIAAGVSGHLLFPDVVFLSCLVFYSNPSAAWDDHLWTAGHTDLAWLERRARQDGKDHQGSRYACSPPAARGHRLRTLSPIALMHHQELADLDFSLLRPLTILSGGPHEMGI